MQFNLIANGLLLGIIIAVSIIFLYKKNRLQEKYNNMRDHYVSIILALASAIDARDPSSFGHTERVMELSIMLGREINRSGHKIDLDSLKLAALLHDVGKIGISEEILRKPGPPTEDEWKEIKKHPSIGANILEPLYELKEVKEAVEHHQEHYNGCGYPEGLHANKIPFMSRIIMIIDAYDAMTSNRSYRVRKSKKEALDEIIAKSGTQFDPGIVDIFIKIISKIGS